MQNSGIKTHLTLQSLFPPDACITIRQQPMHSSCGGQNRFVHWHATDACDILSNRLQRREKRRKEVVQRKSNWLFILHITSRKRIFRLFILTNPRDHDHCARTQMAAKRTKTVAAARPCQNARQTSAQQQHKLLGCFASVDIYSWQRRARTGFSRSEYNGRCRFSRYNNRRKLLHNENRSEHLSTSISSSLNFIKV